MNGNRGFNMMIPKEEVKQESIFQNRISFKLFRRVFSLTLEVKGDEK